MVDPSNITTGCWELNVNVSLYAQLNTHCLIMLGLQLHVDVNTYNLHALGLIFIRF